MISTNFSDAFFEGDLCFCSVKSTWDRILVPVSQAFLTIDVSIFVLIGKSVTDVSKSGKQYLCSFTISDSNQTGKYDRNLPIPFEYDNPPVTITPIPFR